MKITTELPINFWTQLGLFVIVTATLPTGLLLLEYFNLIKL